MSIKPAIREQVRQRAQLACEFRGIAEADVGGQLTIDHFQPRAKGGDDSLDNLIYCCASCNQYKHDYWPSSPDAPSLSNPRHEPAALHLLELDDGLLHPLTAMGTFTLKRLRLNRPPLVTYRLRSRQAADETRLLTRYRDLSRLIEQLLIQQSALIEKQRDLLEEQRTLLRLLLGRET
jgi:hypothetical protein